MNSQSNNPTNIRPNGDIVWPVKGTIRWVDGQNTGLWGFNHKIVPMLMMTDGQVRELNAL